MFLRLMSFRRMLALFRTRVRTVFQPPRDAASSNGERFSLSSTFRSAPWGDEKIFMESKKVYFTSDINNNLPKTTGL